MIMLFYVEYTNKKGEVASHTMSSKKGEVALLMRTDRPWTRS